MKCTILVVLSLFLAFSNISFSQENIETKQETVSQDSENIKNVLLNFVECSLQDVRDGVEFAKAEIPLVLVEVIRVARVRAVFCFVSHIAGMFFIFMFAKFLRNQIVKLDTDSYRDYLSEDDKTCSTMIFALSCIVNLGLLMSALISAYYDLIVFVSPRVYLIEYARNFLR